MYETGPWAAQILADQGADVVNGLIIDDELKEATLTYLCEDDAPEVQHSVLCNLAMWMRFWQPVPAKPGWCSLQIRAIRPAQ